MLTAGRAVAEAAQRETGAVVAHLVSLLGDLDQAEEIFQDTVTVALERWARDGVPNRPGAWLMTAARNRALDALRHRARRGEAHAQLAQSAESTTDAVDEGSVIPDDRLRLMFVCCHPALAIDSRVALTLRLVAGLSAAEIARAFVTQEATIAQRLVRAKRTIRDAGLSYELPPPEDLAERVAAVLRVIYLVFNEGHVASAGDTLSRHDLAEEALRLGRCVADLMPADTEARGLLALMLLHSSRARARTSPNGELIVLEQQDRTLWDRARIAEATQLLGSAGTGVYSLEARIAACHAEAASFAQTRWDPIAALYEQLERQTRSPVTTLNRAVAVAMASGPEAGLALLGPIAEDLTDYHPLYAVRADLLRRLERYTEAALEFEAAASRTENARERAHYETRARECRDRG